MGWYVQMGKRAQRFNDFLDNPPAWARVPSRKNIAVDKGIIGSASLSQKSFLGFCWIQEMLDKKPPNTTDWISIDGRHAYSMEDLQHLFGALDSTGVAFEVRIFGWGDQAPSLSLLLNQHQGVSSIQIETNCEDWAAEQTPISSLPKLRELAFWQADTLTEITEVLKRNPWLERLEIIKRGACEFDSQSLGDLMEALENQTQLKSLSLGFADPEILMALNVLQSCPSVQELDLIGIGTSSDKDPIYEMLGQVKTAGSLSNLRSMSVKSVSNDFLETICYPPSLSKLEVEASEISIGAAGQMTASPELNHLSFRYLELGIDAMSQVSSMDQLRRFTLYRVKLPDNAFDAWQRKCPLESLDVRSCPGAIVSLQRLQRLHPALSVVRYPGQPRILRPVFVGAK